MGTYEVSEVWINMVDDEQLPEYVEVIVSFKLPTENVRPDSTVDEIVDNFMQDIQFEAEGCFDGAETELVEIRDAFWL